MAKTLTEGIAQATGTAYAAARPAVSAAPAEAALRRAGLARFKLIRPQQNTAPQPAREQPAPRQRGPTPQSAADSGRIQAWLTQLGRTSPQILAADVMEVPDPGSAATRIAAWPEGNACAEVALDLARKAVTGKKFIVAADPGVAKVRLVAVPLVLAGMPRAAIVARFAHGPECSVSADVKHLMQASAWLHVLKPAAAPAATEPGTRAALELLAAVLDQRELQSAALAVVNHLAATIGAARVCLGFWRKGEVRLLAVSGSSEFNATTALALAIRAAMAESLRQGVELHLPEDPAAAARETAAQGMLLREARCAALWTIPFADGGAPVGAVTIEWAQAARATAQTRERCQALLALAGPVLAALDRAGRGFHARLRDGLAQLARRAVGPQRPLLKLALICGAMLLIASAVFSGQHRVASSAVLRGTVQRVVLAPVDGFVATATVRPGDVVAADAVMATLDDQALRLEVAKWQADYERLMSEYREAMAVLDSTRSRCCEPSSTALRPTTSWPKTISPARRSARPSPAWSSAAISASPSALRGSAVRPCSNWPRSTAITSARVSRSATSGGFSRASAGGCCCRHCRAPNWTWSSSVSRPSRRWSTAAISSRSKPAC